MSRRMLEIPPPDSAALARMSRGSRLRALRQARGWTAEELAQRSGVNAEQISRFETGTREPSEYHLERLGAALDISPEMLGAHQQLDDNPVTEMLFVACRRLPPDKQTKVLKYVVDLLTV